MPELSDAEEHLRVIRSLMERATIYRAISAPAALIGGLLACGAAWVLREDTKVLFWFPVWSTVLAVAILVNFYFLRREAIRRQAPFVSPGMRMAIRSMAPPLSVGLVFTALFLSGRDLEVLVLVWIMVYGLALLSTSHFAPRSLVILGIVFLTTGLLMCVLLPGSHTLVLDADGLMAVTFGGFHLIYAACTWPRRA